VIVHLVTLDLVISLYRLASFAIDELTFNTVSGLASEQSHKNDGDKESGGQRGGSHEQHVKAGQQSHKNDK